MQETSDLMERLEGLRLRLEAIRSTGDVSLEDLTALSQSFLTLEKMVNLVIELPISSGNPDRGALILGTAKAKMSLQLLMHGRADRLMEEIQEFQNCVVRLGCEHTAQSGLPALDGRLEHIESALKVLRELGLQLAPECSAMLEALNRAFGAAEEGMAMQAASELLTFKRPH